MAKRCSRCRQMKPDEDFAWRRIAKGEKDSYCRPCRAEYKQEHYAKNKQRYADQAQAWREETLPERRKSLAEIFRGNPCADCGESDPVVLEFDHLSDKIFDIGQGFRNKKWDAVIKEIEKCEIVCVNCHRRRTARRTPTHRYVALLSRRGASAKSDGR